LLCGCPVRFMTAQTIMATARHVKQVAAASRSLASPSAIEAKVQVVRKNFEIRAISKNAVGVGLGLSH
jgi:hypothetical protein